MSYKSASSLNGTGLLLWSDEDAQREIDEEVKAGYRCPVCKKKAKIICNCTMRDSTCENGHHWHMEGDKVVEGKGIH